MTPDLTFRRQVDARVQRPVFRLRWRHGVAMLACGLLWVGAYVVWANGWASKGGL